MPVIKKELCTGCGVCMYYCPEEAISMDDERKAQISQEVCAECGKCIEVCPRKIIQ